MGFELSLTDCIVVDRDSGLEENNLDAGWHKTQQVKTAHRFCVDNAWSETRKTAEGPICATVM